MAKAQISDGRFPAYGVLGFAILGAVTLATVAVVASVGPIAQPPGYHHFADSRPVFGIRNFWNVASNVLFVLVGAIGGVRVLRGDYAGLPQLRAAWATLHVAVVFVGLGSAFYHFNPGNQTLVWDRLPMTVAFAAFLTIVVGEHIHARAAAASLLPLVLIGVLSVWIWQFTEAQGRGDLRIYVLVQFLSLIMVVLVLALFGVPGLRDRAFWWVVAGYVFAKLFELGDRPVYVLTGTISGHVFKHLFAAGSLAMLLPAMRKSPARTGQPKQPL